MAELKMIVAHTLGNPWGGLWNNPWSPGEPSVGTRVAILTYEVTDIDGAADSIRSYHVAPAEHATEGAIAPEHAEPQGVAVRWTGCGTGTVVASLTDKPSEPRCEVEPDDSRLIGT